MIRLTDSFYGEYMSFPSFSRADFHASNGITKGPALFKELEGPDPIFTLKEEDCEWKGKHLYSLPRLYLELTESDPTEWNFAITIFGSWETWEKISEYDALKPYVAGWRRQKELRIRSVAAQVLIKEAQGGSYLAAKELLNRDLSGQELAALSPSKRKERDQKTPDEGAAPEMDHMKEFLDND